MMIVARGFRFQDLISFPSLKRSAAIAAGNLAAG
jgi:hypothetical protein